MIRRVRLSLLALAAALALQGIVSVPAAASPSETAYDPIEPVNRVVFGFNDILDRVLIGPLATAYKTILPDVVQNVVRDFTRNLKSPLIMANEALQGDGEGFGRAFGRMMMNTTIGLGGLIDVAGMHGIPYESEDFGQTLGVWGVGSGPYLVLPVLGPSSLRDTAGLVVDSAADPVTASAEATQRDEDLMWVRLAAGIDARARMDGVIVDQRRNAVDYYASMRSIYLQSRESAVKDGAGTAEIPDYDEAQP